MNELIYDWARWLDNTAWSTSIHESFYLYNWIETTHVLSLTLSLGLLFLIDFRLLGLVFADVDARLFAERLRWPMWIGFVIMFVTGILLFYAVPVRTAQSLWFRLKLLLLLLAALNALLFHWQLARLEDESFPPGLRSGALASIILWLGVVLCGRLIAYDWFDCVQEPSEWIRVVAGCVDGQEVY